MNQLLAYHNNPEIKETHLAWLRADIAADRLIAGSYGDKANGGWQGCQWGCFLRSKEPHSIVEAAVGIPRQLSRIADGIFEALSRGDREKGQEFAEAFFVAIQPGANLLIPYWRFMEWLLIDPADGVLRFAKTERTRKAITQVAELYQRLLNGETVTQAEWKAAAAAAAAAADAAAYAAAAADAAAYAAAYAAAAAGYLKARERQAEKLLQLLREAK